MLNEVSGMTETGGLVGVIEAAGAMVGAANVVLIGYEEIGSGLVTVTMHGDVDATRASVDASVAAADAIGEVVSRHMTPRPHSDIGKVLP